MHPGTEPGPGAEGSQAGRAAVAVRPWSHRRTLASGSDEEHTVTIAYTGHVDPDGPWIERMDGQARIRKLSVGPMDNNAYVVSCLRTGSALLVDVPTRPARLREALTDVDPVAAVLTHGHADHVGAWEALADDGLEIWAHPGDVDLLPRAPDRLLADGEVLEIGDLRIEVLHVPGHTDGSLLYLLEGADRAHLFTGDTLFPGGHGRTTTPDAHERIMDGLEARVFDRLDDATWVYPGHGDDTTLGVERPHLAEWRARGW
jgi:glyoxylase-like metal-dependent hydrolase (beta-lactamase superfamily II)